jgi:hypothetical protein
MPGDNDKPADAKDKAQGGKDSGADRLLGKWPKRIYAVAGVIAVVGGVFAFGTQVDHWFTGLAQSSDSTCHMSVSDQIERSPNLGISFHQNDQLALMSYANSTKIQIPMIDVCLSSAPFEIWFPALGPNSVVRICTSPTAGIFRVNPFYVGQNNAGCLYPPTGIADHNYASGFLSESSVQEPSHVEIVRTRAEPASGGDDKFFVSTLYSVPTGKGLKFHTVSLSHQTTNLYLIIYTSDNYNAHGSDANIEHYVLAFK